MSVEGVPSGWELVRIGRPRRGEWAIGGDGVPWEYSRADTSTEVWPIVRKTEPICTWTHGVFNDGWIAEDKDGGQSWFPVEPSKDGEEWFSGNVISIGVAMIQPVVFRSGVPWTERVQKVGPSVEK